MYFNAVDLLARSLHCYVLPCVDSATFFSSLSVPIWLTVFPAPFAVLSFYCSYPLFLILLALKQTAELVSNGLLSSCNVTLFLP